MLRSTLSFYIEGEGVDMNLYSLFEFDHRPIQFKTFHFLCEQSQLMFIMLLDLLLRVQFI